MTAAFAELQAIYARHRVATYPIKPDKTPIESHYTKIGAPRSRALAAKYPDATACGFCAGSRNRITIVDVDSTDERLVAEIEARFGPSPLRVVTPSGGRHIYYRHTGERRQIRALPSVDLLGNGHVVAALSVVAKGRYAIERGTLDDLARLPPMRACDAAMSPSPSRIPEGHRNTALFKYCRAIVSHCDTFDQLLDAASTWADNELATQLPASEIIKTCRSVWDYRGGRKRIVNHVVEGPNFAALSSNQSAIALFAYLSATNGAKSEFWIADGLAGLLGWPRRSIPRARQVLLDLGIVKCIRPAGKKAPAVYRWGPAVHAPTYGFR